MRGVFVTKKECKQMRELYKGTIAKDIAKKFNITRRCVMYHVGVSVTMNERFAGIIGVLLALGFVLSIIATVIVWVWILS